MIKIEAVIRPERLDEVKLALDDIGLTGITVLEARGAGQQRGYVHHYRGAEYRVNLLEKVKIELVIPDEREEEAIEAIMKAGRTGEIGDGKIFVLPVSQAVRVRTGERGRSALG